eukprot:3480293-Pleurochrysis_carterae.AAC.1
MRVWVTLPGTGGVGEAAESMGCYVRARHLRLRANKAFVHSRVCTKGFCQIDSPKKVLERTQRKGGARGSLHTDSVLNIEAAAQLLSRTREPEAAGEEKEQNGPGLAG